MLARNTKPANPDPEAGMLIAFPDHLRGTHSEITTTTTGQDALAISPDQLQLAVKRDVMRESDLEKYDALSLARYGLQKLRADGQLTSEEFSSLCRVCDALFAAQRNQVDTETAHSAVRRVHDDFLSHQTSSPMALAIASVASGALASDLGMPKATHAPIAEPKSNLGIGLVGGLMIGGLIGLSTAGALGGLIGCLIGGLAGGLAGAWVKS